MPSKENEVLQTIGTYLQLKKYFFWRTNNIPIFMPDKKVFRAMPKFSRKGVSDFIMLKDGIAYFIEVKAKKGKQSDFQKEFEEDVIKHGGKYILAYSLEDIQKNGL